MNQGVVFLLEPPCHTAALTLPSLGPLRSLKTIRATELVFMWVLSLFSALEMNTEI